jgi:hypothetical protein
MCLTIRRSQADFKLSHYQTKTFIYVEATKNGESNGCRERRADRKKNWKRACKPVEQAENHKKGPRWSWAGNHMGNV